MKARLAWLFAAALTVTSCGINMQSGTVQHDTRSIPRDTSRFPRVDLRMGEGPMLQVPQQSCIPSLIES